MDTVSLVEEVGFDALFTFIYSPPSRYESGLHAGSRHPRGKAEVVR